MSESGSVDEPGTEYFSAGSSNGRTAGSGPVCLGSNPSPATT